MSFLPLLILFSHLVLVSFDKTRTGRHKNKVDTERDQRRKWAWRPSLMICGLGPHGHIFNNPIPCVPLLDHISCHFQGTAPCLYLRNYFWTHQHNHISSGSVCLLLVLLLQTTFLSWVSHNYFHNFFSPLYIWSANSFSFFPSPFLPIQDGPRLTLKMLFSVVCSSLQIKPLTQAYW